MRSTALILVARYPRIGFVKTRLARDLGHDFATAFYRACAEHAFRALLEVRSSVRRYISVAEPADVPAVRSWAGSGFTIIPQREGDFGARLRESLQHAHSAGCGSGMVIASDTPDLSAAVLEQAVDALADRNAAVLGAAPDGGYYLLGLHEPHPSLFSDIPWSTEQVARVTESRIAQLGLRCHHLPALADIDTRADLEAWLTGSSSRHHPLRDLADRALAGQDEARRSA